MATGVEKTIAWLLEGDPAIRWQTLRDLVGASDSVVERERRNVARRGWGARLLARQDVRGTWARGKSSDGGLYSPKWISTTYTLLLLRDLGLPPSNAGVRKGCVTLLDEGLQRDGGVNYGWGGRSETCITGMVLSMLAYFEVDDDRVDRLTRYLLAEQMPDGGWNCQRDMGATHSSVHTTISALEGLRLRELRKSGGVARLRAAQRRGREFLLAHRLFRSHRTGEPMKADFLRFAFPPRWHYDVLRGLDYFQAVGARRDERLTDGIDLVRRTQRADGRWPLPHRYKGRVYFELEKVGAPSRWNTLRALRVLKWWER